MKDKKSRNEREKYKKFWMYPNVRRAYETILDNRINWWKCLGMIFIEFFLEKNANYEERI